MDRGVEGSPRILLVEDDPASRLFLATVLEAMPATVVVAGSLAEARRCIAGDGDAGDGVARDGGFDLWLFDANLPDGSGAGLLEELRARDAVTPALAHTAGCDRGALDALLAAGFAEVLVKPLPAAALQAAVRRALGHSERIRIAEPPMPCGKLPVWDDAVAAAALNGDAKHVAALRSLFLAELPAQRDAVLAALDRNDMAALAAQLHRLSASCGFAGAARLAAAVDGLREVPASLDARARFAHAARDVLDPA